MSPSSQNPEAEILRLFAECHTAEERYRKIIELGRLLPAFPPEYKVEENLVKGCQSLLYLHARSEGNCLYFSATSDALISAGLASIFIHLYSGTSAEKILKTDLSILEKLGIPASLTPSRANGLYSIHLRMRQEALKFLISSSPTQE